MERLGGHALSLAGKEFAPSDETHIDRDDDETDDTKLSYTDRERTPATLYYYILVPKSPNFSQGKAQAETPDLERSAEASFTLLKADGDEAGATIGGAVTVVFEIELENAKAGSENAVVRIQETGKEGGVTHKPEEDHIDLAALDFTKKEGWQQWLDDDGDGPQPASWKTATSAPVGTGKWRRSYDWNTAGAAIPMGDSKLLNHNGEHTISLAKVDGDEGSNTLDFGDESADVEEKKVTVGNLVIEEENVKTSSDSSDYFAYSPTASESSSLRYPWIKFTFSNEYSQETQPSRYHWWVYVRESKLEGLTNLKVFEGDVNNSGEVYVPIVPMRGEPNYMTSGEDMVWGTYSFDITVKDNATGDFQRLRSQNISVPLTMTGTDGEILQGEDGKPIAGHSLALVNASPSATSEDEVDRDSPYRDDDVSWEASYMLKGSKNASKMNIVLVKPNLTEREITSAPTQVDVPILNVPVYREQEEEQSAVNGEQWKCLFIAVDDTPDQHRDHKRHSAIAVNRSKDFYQVKFRFETGSKYRPIAIEQGKLKQALDSVDARLGVFYKVNPTTKVATSSAYITLKYHLGSIVVTDRPVTWQVYRSDGSLADSKTDTTGVYSANFAQWGDTTSFGTKTLTVQASLGSKHMLQFKVDVSAVKDVTERQFYQANEGDSDDKRRAQMIIGDGKLLKEIGAEMALEWLDDTWSNQPYQSALTLQNWVERNEVNIDGGPSNAFKHTAWNAFSVRLLIRDGLTLAEADKFAKECIDAHEVPGQQPTSAMDLQNNGSGRYIASLVSGGLAVRAPVMQARADGLLKIFDNWKGQGDAPVLTHGVLINSHDRWANDHAVAH